MYAVTDLEQLLEFLFGREINLDQCAKYKHNFVATKQTSSHYHTSDPTNSVCCSWKPITNVNTH